MARVVAVLGVEERGLHVVSEADRTGTSDPREETLGERQLAMRPSAADLVGGSPAAAASCARREGYLPTAYMSGRQRALPSRARCGRTGRMSRARSSASPRARRA